VIILALYNLLLAPLVAFWPTSVISLTHIDDFLNGIYLININMVGEREFYGDLRAYPQWDQGQSP